MTMDTYFVMDNHFIYLFKNFMTHQAVPWGTKD